MQQQEIIRRKRDGYALNEGKIRLFKATLKPQY